MTSGSAHNDALAEARRQRAWLDAKESLDEVRARPDVSHEAILVAEEHLREMEQQMLDGWKPT